MQTVFSSVTHSCFLLIGRQHQDVLDLHHGSDGADLLGAAAASRLQQHLGKHGAERELCHPQAQGLGQPPVAVHTWTRSTHQNGAGGGGVRLRQLLKVDVATTQAGLVSPPRA